MKSSPKDVYVGLCYSDASEIFSKSRKCCSRSGYKEENFNLVLPGWCPRHWKPPQDLLQIVQKCLPRICTRYETNFLVLTKSEHPVVNIKIKWAGDLCISSKANLRLKKLTSRLVRWFQMKRHLLKTLTTWDSSLGLLWWKEKTDSHKLSPDLHMHAVSHTHLPKN